MAQPPYVDPRSVLCSGEAPLRIGRVVDGSVGGALGVPTGVPSGCVLVQQTLNSPAAADDDRFVDAVATGTAAKTYTLLTNSMPDTYTGEDGKTYYVARNVTASLSGTKTVNVTVTGLDTQGQPESEVLAFVASAGPVVGVKAFSQILTVSTNGTATDRDLSVGFGNVFGCNYPFYSDQGLRGVLYDADGADYPNTPMTQGGVIPGVTTQVSNVVDLTDLRVWNAFATNLPGTAATDDLGLVTLASTVGTDWDVAVQTSDLDNIGTGVPFYAAFVHTLPATYVSGGAISVVINCGMITSVAGTSCTIDVQAFLLRAPAADLCITAAQDMNSLTAANKTFVCTPTGLVAGGQILIRVAILATDTAATAASFARINKISVSCLQTATATSSSSPLFTFTAGDPTNANVDAYGTVLIGSDNTSTGTLVPDGTKDYAVWYVCNDTQGVLNSSTGLYNYDSD